MESASTVLPVVVAGLEGTELARRLSPFLRRAASPLHRALPGTGPRVLLCAACSATARPARLPSLHESPVADCMLSIAERPRSRPEQDCRGAVDEQDPECEAPI